MGLEHEHLFMRDWGWGWGFGLASVIFGLLQFLAFALLVWFVVRSLRDRPVHRPPSSSSAISVLEERYARGEITREEFFERRSVLLGQTQPPEARPTQEI